MIGIGCVWVRLSNHFACELILQISGTLRFYISVSRFRRRYDSGRRAGEWDP